MNCGVNEGQNPAPAAFSPDNDVLPRSPRKARRPKSDRGLPPDEELSKLARIYLETQRKLWPQLVKADQLAKPTDAILGMMVEDFKFRHRGGKVERAAMTALASLVQKFGGNYNRYSCDNSDPKSIADQMVNALQKAADEKRFIPWFYVFCDYSVSGLDSSRRGYQSYKLLLQEEGHAIETTYVDDFTRASRDEIEWWQLASLSKRLARRLVGASDGFRLDDPDWDLKLTVYALVSRLFIKSLRQKVRRGMIGTARRRGTLGKPPLGFTRKIKRDASGEVIRGPDGDPKTEYCFHEPTKAIVNEIFEAFAVKRMTPFNIAKEFNRRMVDGYDGWTAAVIKKILINPAYVGVFVWNETHREFNLEDRRWEVIKNPYTEWVVYFDPSLCAVPVKWWKKARRELMSRRTAKQPRIARGQGDVADRAIRRSASSLFSDTLVCGYCRGALRLYRSAGKFKDLYCPHGRTGARQCKLSTSKSLHIIEESLLRFLSNNLFTEPMLRDLVEKANKFLTEEAARPREDLTPKIARERQLRDKIDKLVRRVENEDNKILADGYDRRIKELQNDLNELQKEIRDGQRRNSPPPAQLDVARVAAYLADLRAVLGLEMSASAEYLRQLTGPIEITQEAIPGRKRGAQWIATFTPNIMAMLAHTGREKNYPDCATLEYLSARIWINVESAKIPVTKMPKHERVANDPEFIRHRAAGRNAHQISRLMQLTYDLVVSTVRFVDTGERPKTNPPGAKARSRGTPAREVVYKKIAAEVARLKDDQLMSFSAISKQLGIGEETVGRAYTLHQRREQAAAVEAGRRLPSTKYSLIGRAKRDEIQRLRAAGKKENEIAALVGVGKSTVNRVLKQTS